MRTLLAILFIVNMSVVLCSDKFCSEHPGPSNCTYADAEPLVCGDNRVQRKTFRNRCEFCSKGQKDGYIFCGYGDCLTIRFPCENQ